MRPSIPKRCGRCVEGYRHAIDLRAAGDPRAVDAFRTLARQQPLMIDLWRHLADAAASTDRNDLAVEAFRHVVQSEPDNAEARLGLATGLLRLRKLDEARQAAQRLANDEFAGGRARADAHEVLARIALARHDLDLARSEAELAEHEDASRPVTAYVAGRIAFDARRYVEALEQFEAALAIITTANARPLGDLRLLTAEAMMRADRLSEAEYLFEQELADTPLSLRARTGLTAVYTATGRSREAAALAH